MPREAFSHVPVSARYRGQLIDARDDVALKDALAGWDGKSAPDIETIYDHYAQEPSFITSLVSLMRQPKLQDGATWLLKRYLEEEGELSGQTIASIYATLPYTVNWQAKLHLLQCIGFMPVRSSRKVPVESFVRRCLMDENKFVRAWAYSGFYELAMQYPEYHREMRQFFCHGRTGRAGISPG